MKTCSKCGETKDSSEFYKGRNQCKFCLSECGKAYYEAHIEEVTARHKVYRETTREAAREYGKTHYAENLEKERARIRAKSKDNPDYYREYYEANKETKQASNKAWRIANPEKMKVIRQRERALRTGAKATLTQEEWEKIWQEFNGRCFWCNDPATQMDHVVPLRPRQGELQGHHTKGNVVPSCQPCNNGPGGKHNKDPLVFLFEMREKMKRKG